ncbi:MAG TPA: hypothetical protein VLB69_00270, partial [Rudaea sp.]|nr:hypothetical protein [Rudaea sp.]
MNTDETTGSAGTDIPPVAEAEPVSADASAPAAGPGPAAPPKTQLRAASGKALILSTDQQVADYLQAYAE